MQEKDYIAVLKQGLAKKIQILDRIIEKNNQQKLLLADPELTPEDFEQNLTEKANLVEQLIALDNGFEQVYERVKEELTKNREVYLSDIRAMQKYIAEIMEKSTQIQTQEQRNKELALQKFSAVKKQIREVKTGKKAVDQYYRNMMKLNYIDPQFLDDKK